MASSFDKTATLGVSMLISLAAAKVEFAFLYLSSFVAFNSLHWLLPCSLQLKGSSFVMESMEN